MNEMKFELGKVVATRGVLELISMPEIAAAVMRHQSGDWGIVCAEDKALNEEALKEGYRLHSAYRSSEGIKFWIITEADRSATTVLLPEEY